MLLRLLFGYISLLTRVLAVGGFLAKYALMPSTMAAASLFW
jgi:hypothetical protein